MSKNTFESIGCIAVFSVVFHLFYSCSGFISFTHPMLTMLLFPASVAVMLGCIALLADKIIIWFLSKMSRKKYNNIIKIKHIAWLVLGMIYLGFMLFILH